MEHMDSFLRALKEKSQKLQKRIVLPETTDDRVIKAAAKALAEKIAVVHLVGNKAQLEAKAAALGVSIAGAYFLDTQNDDITPLAQALYEKRKHKGMTIEEATALVKNDPNYTGAAMIGAGMVDGMVSGSLSETAKVIKAAIYGVGLKKGIPLVSSYFLMVVPDRSFGDDGVLFFADCGVNPNPNAEQLADIAKTTADSYKSVVGKEPRIGMLSFSTKGSAAHADVDKVTTALGLAKTKYPELLIDGELQLDAAVIPAVGSRKAPGSAVAGKANILIFPDLDAGNIGYKLVERFAKACAFGPILQGLAQPVNDLSRGCSVDDIVNVIEITSLLAAV